MTLPVQLSTPRLHLRQWLPEDFAPFAALNADPQVMACFPSPLTPSQSDDLAARIQGNIARDGWGFWALELKATGAFIGFTGLNRPDGLPFSPCVEVGWRLAAAHWGKGLATEAASAALDFAFNQLAETRVVAFTATTNRRSQAVMARLGMTDTGENFDHPSVPEDSPLREHLLFRISAGVWLAAAGG